MPDETYRLRTCFRKDGRLAYLGHLEVIGTVERSVRRSRLPFRVGNGFARRMGVQFSQALPVGAYSEGEYFDLTLTSFVDPDEAFERLRDAMPPALGPLRSAYVLRKIPALEAWLTRSSWLVEIEGGAFDAAVLDEALRQVAAVGYIDYLRGDKPKRADLGRTLVSWTCEDAGECVTVRLETRSSNEGALRPAILLDAAFATQCLSGASRTAQRVARVAQAHEEGARLVNPFDEALLLSLT